MEFWALIGLASMDSVFLKQLFENRENPERIVREYGFRLSRWEMGELRRILENDKAFHHLHAICHGIWAEAFNPRDERPCWWSAERSAEHDVPGDEPYVHPLKNGHPVPRPRPDHGDSD